MTKDEPLKMAIEALLYGTDHTKAVKACKEALKQPKEWQGLSDDEIKDKAIFFNVSDISLEDFIRLIDRTLKERNT